MQRTLDLHYDKLIIGADLSALSYSLVNSAPIIYTRKLKPYKKIYKPSYDDDNEDDLKIWEDAMFFLSFSNLSPFADNIQSIRIVDDNNLKAVTNENFVINIHFNNLAISDDYKISGLPSPCGMTDTKNLVVDYFKTISGKKIFGSSAKRPHDFFLYWIDFYNSERFINNPELKDIIAYSKLSNKQLQNINYSHSIAKISLLRTLKTLGVKPDFRKKLVIEHEKREVYPLGKNKYKNLPANFKMLYNIADLGDRKTNNYMEYLERCIYGKLNDSKALSGDCSDSES